MTYANRRRESHWFHQESRALPDQVGPRPHFLLCLAAFAAVLPFLATKEIAGDSRIACRFSVQVSGYDGPVGRKIERESSVLM